MKKFPIAGLLSTVIILGATVAFAKITEPLTGIPYIQPTGDDGMVVAKRSMIDRAENSLVLIGDSSCMHGLVPDIISKELDVPVVNLGSLSSLTTVGFSEMAHSVTEKHKIKGLVYAILPQSLEVSSDTAREYGQIGRYLTGYGNNYGLYKVSLTERLKWISKKYQFNTFPPEWGGSYSALVKSTNENAGWLPERAKELIIEEIKTEFLADEFSLSGLIAAEANATRLGIPIYFVMNPKPEGSVSKLYVEQVNQYLTELQTTQPQLKFLNNFFTLSDSNFGTETHLRPEAATVYTADIADKLFAVYPKQ